MEQNSVDPEQLSKIDLDAEFGTDLSLSEAIYLARQKFPTLWRESEDRFSDRPKQIIFVKELVEKIIAGRVKVTYRKAPKMGTYYIINNRFRQSSDASRVLIEFYQTDTVDPYKLTDYEAQLAGVESSEKIRELFERWYGKPIPTLYRNWFRIKEINSDQTVEALA